ncbi:MAG: hypothetical protein JG765_441 [Cereibacter sp.]|jgi:hypothetical protein|nr:hypothetical protein [Cereibacter sp.]
MTRRVSAMSSTLSESLFDRLRMGMRVKLDAPDESARDRSNTRGELFCDLSGIFRREKLCSLAEAQAMVWMLLAVAKRPVSGATAESAMTT